MADAIRDNNHRPVLCGVSSVDGITLVPIKVDAVSGGAKTDETTSLSVPAIDYAPRDGNHRVVMMGVNSVTGDPIPIYVNPSTGEILTDR